MSTLLFVVAFTAAAIIIIFVFFPGAISMLLVKMGGTVARFQRRFRALWRRVRIRGGE
jgi:hypothetical protein